MRRGTLDDVPAVLRLMDIAAQWLVSQGKTGQWGTEPFSTTPRRIEQATEFANSGGLWLAVTASSATVETPESSEPAAAAKEDASSDPDSRNSAGAVVGALTVGGMQSYVQPVTEPELYIRLLVTDRNWKGHGIGTMLLDHARKLARELGISLLRLDCYAGDDGKLVKYYESQGFERTDAFEVKGWPCQVLAQRLEAVKN